MAAFKIIQNLRHAKIQAQKAGIKLKKYKDLNDDDPSVIQASTTSQLV